MFKNLRQERDALEGQVQDYAKFSAFMVGAPAAPPQPLPVPLPVDTLTHQHARWYVSNIANGNPLLPYKDVFRVKPGPQPKCNWREFAHCVLHIAEVENVAIPDDAAVRADLANG